MAVIVSSILFAKQDIQGNRYTDGYLLVEFRDTGYMPGGEVIDLTANFNRIEHIEAFPASGALEYNPRVNQGDFPANAGSGRVQAWYLGSGVLNLNISGLPVSILSGTILSFASGIMHGGSGRLAFGGSGFVNAGALVPTEVLSGVALSGMRTKLYVLGY